MIIMTMIEIIIVSTMNCYSVDWINHRDDIMRSIMMAIVMPVRLLARENGVI